jgi:hypothetical protein
MLKNCVTILYKPRISLDNFNEISIYLRVIAQLGVKSDANEDAFAASGVSISTTGKWL